MKKTLLLIVLFVAVSALSESEFRARFESYEHLRIEDTLSLKWNIKRFNLPNGLVISLGEMIAMPDFYGIIGLEIGSQDDFKRAFDTLAQNPNSLLEAQRIITEIRKNLPAHEAQVTWNCLTGGACGGLAWWLTPGRYLELAASNMDHFSDGAFNAYRWGHLLAMETAQRGFQTQDRKQLENAYAYEAFALHYLSDRFSSGHIRVPRKQLAEGVTPSVVGSLLANAMHNEESLYGIHEHNLRGERWVAFGDELYLTKENQKNREHIQEALQRSIDQVTEAFELGQINDTPEAIAQLIPFADELPPVVDLDIAPMFYHDQQNGILMRRSELFNLREASWTSSWYGWSTLALLKSAGR